MQKINKAIKKKIFSQKKKNEIIVSLVIFAMIVISAALMTFFENQIAGLILFIFVMAMSYFFEEVNQVLNHYS